MQIKADRVVIGKRGKIGGNLRYEASREAIVDQGALIEGQTIFKQVEYEQPRHRLLAFLGVLWVLKLLALMAAAVVIYLLLPSPITEVTGIAVQRFGHELLVGFLVFAAVPALILVLFVTVLGWFLGLLILFFYGAFLLLSSVFGALILTRLFSDFVLKRAVPLSWPLILAGVGVYQLIGLIPFVGWLCKFVFSSWVWAAFPTHCMQFGIVMEDLIQACPNSWYRKIFPFIVPQDPEPGSGSCSQEPGPG